MAKFVNCNEVDPSSDCQQVIRGSTEEELRKNAAEHIKQHGLLEMNPELVARIKALTKEE